MPVQKIAKYGKKYETAAEKEAAEKLLPVVLKSTLDEIKIVQNYNTSSVDKVTIDLIQTLVCKYFKISKNEMLSSRRSRYLVRPRQTAIYLTKILTSKSLPEIGREFSNRDHTTIIHSVKTIEKLKKRQCWDSSSHKQWFGQTLVHSLDTLCEYSPNRFIL